VRESAPLLISASSPAPRLLTAGELPPWATAYPWVTGGYRDPAAHASAATAAASLLTWPTRP
jgi:hypothetical protein